jgi:hypothetical protein
MRYTFPLAESISRSPAHGGKQETVAVLKRRLQPAARAEGRNDFFIFSLATL